jgi:hypothetical protein
LLDSGFSVVLMCSPASDHCARPRKAGGHMDYRLGVDARRFS